MMIVQRALLLVLLAHQAAAFKVPAFVQSGLELFLHEETIDSFLTLDEDFKKIASKTFEVAKTMVKLSADTVSRLKNGVSVCSMCKMMVKMAKDNQRAQAKALVGLFFCKVQASCHVHLAAIQAAVDDAHEISLCDELVRVGDKFGKEFVDQQMEKVHNQINAHKLCVDVKACTNKPKPGDPPTTTPEPDETYYDDGFDRLSEQLRRENDTIRRTASIAALFVVIGLARLV